MNEQEFNLSKIIAEAGAKNATGEIKNSFSSIFSYFVTMPLYS